MSQLKKEIKREHEILADLPKTNDEEWLLPNPKQILDIQRIKKKGKDLTKVLVHWEV